ncbi:MAG: PAS domain S-box protein, partial [Magnetococcales bacterium]|nr:PAS domain S-box protein [Magnetococcales bacterium]
MTGNPREGASDAPGGFRLLRYFSVTSFVSMALAAWVPAFLFQRIEHHSMLSLGETQNVAISQVLSNALWPSLSGFLSTSREIKPGEIRSHPLVAYLDQFIGKLLTNLKVRKVKILNASGVILYASSTGEIGQDQSRIRGVSAALENDLSSELLEKGDPLPGSSEIADRHLILTYVPLFKDDRVRGVFELYYDLEELLAHMHRSQNWMVLGVTSLFIALYLLLFGIVRRADFLIGEQNRRLNHYLYEIRSNNETLEKRVAERTETLRLTNQVLTSEIVERQLAENELLKLTRAVEQSPASVIITDLSGHIEYVNSAFCRISGYDPEEVIGKNPSLLKSGLHQEQTYQELWQTLKKGEEWRGEFLNRKKNGDLYWELASISPIRDK